MADPDDALFWDYRATALRRQLTHGEKLFEFVSAATGATLTCEVRFVNESVAWEVRFLDATTWEFYAHGGFALKEWAVRWAEQQRDVMLS